MVSQQPRLSPNSENRKLISPKRCWLKCFGWLCMPNFISKITMISCFPSSSCRFFASFGASSGVRARGMDGSFKDLLNKLVGCSRECSRSSRPNCCVNPVKIFAIPFSSTPSTRWARSRVWEFIWRCVGRSQARLFLRKNPNKSKKSSSFPSI